MVAVVPQAPAKATPPKPAAQPPSPKISQTASPESSLPKPPVKAAKPLASQPPVAKPAAATPSIGDAKRSAVTTPDPKVAKRKGDVLPAPSKLKAVTPPKRVTKRPARTQPKSQVAPAVRRTALANAQPEAPAQKASNPAPAPKATSASAPAKVVASGEPRPAPARSQIAEELARRLPELFVDSPRPKRSVKLPTIPPILLEGDRPRVPAPLAVAVPALAKTSEPPPLPAGPDVVPEFQLSATSSSALPTPASPAPSAVPAESGPGRPAEFPTQATLWLTARDPFCLCAHWELDAHSLAAFAQMHPDGAWWLRVRAGTATGWLVNEQPLPTHANHRFVPVVMAGATYVAEIGYRFADGSWRGLALSAPATTPPDGPGEFSAEVEVANVQSAPVTPASLPSTPPDHPEPVVHPVLMATPSWPTPRQAIRLTELVWEPVVRRDTPSSAEVAEWQARTVITEVPGEAGVATPWGGAPTSGELAGAPGVTQGGPGSPSSEAVAVPSALAVPPDFWFKVNAELIIYGSTERDARVTIAGRPVALRPDGSFSFRFALPDGDFTLPAVAVNAAGTDGRTAQLRFTRATVLTGEVGVHPQDVRLKPPVAEAIT